MPMDPTCRLPLPYRTPPRWILRATLAAALLANTSTTPPALPVAQILDGASLTIPVTAWWSLPVWTRAIHR